MAVTSTQCSQEFTGNDSASTFSVPFRVLDKSHLVVTITKDGVARTLVENTDYTLSNLTAYTGWNVNLIDPAPGNFGAAKVLATGETLKVKNSPPLTQPTKFRGQQSFRAETHEESLDRLTIIAQGITEEIVEIQNKLATTFKGVLAGTKNGVNKTFTLTHNGTPLARDPSLVFVWCNFPLIEGIGYSRSGTTITFTDAPLSTDDLFGQGTY